MKIHSVLVKEYCALLIDADLTFPSFLKVNRIFKDKTTLYFWGEVFQAVQFIEHYQAYVIEKKNQFTCLQELHLSHPSPLHIRHIVGLGCSATEAIVPKNAIVPNTLDMK